jgi:hypothetical protein
MKKVLWLIVCLMTMVVSVNAQDDMYYGDKKANNSSSYWDNTISFGGSVGFGKLRIDRGNDVNFYELEVMVYNTFFSWGFSDSDNNHNLYYNWQLGHYINIVNFGKTSWNGGKEHQIKIAPLIEFINYVHVDGHELHENVPHHNCQVWVDTSENKPLDTFTFGVGILYRYKALYLSVNATKKSIKGNIGLCITF